MIVSWLSHVGPVRWNRSRAAPERSPESVDAAEAAIYKTANGGGAILPPLFFERNAS